MQGEAMKGILTIVVVAGAALSLAACAGNTDEGSGIRATQAMFNAHGRTTGKPSTWWWEYDTVKAELGTASDTEVCGNGAGPKEADRRCGPAESPAAAGDLPVNVVVTGLSPDTTYYYRACAQDQGAGPACGKVVTFRTTKADSTARIEQRPGDSLDPVVFSAASTTQQGLANSPMRFSTFRQTNGALRYRLEDPVGAGGNPGTSIVPVGAGCQSLKGRPIDDAVECTPQSPEADIHLGDKDDHARVEGPGLSHFIYVDCGSGSDTLVIDQSRGFDNYGWTNCETVTGG
jgi:predicted small secreted protein